MTLVHILVFTLLGLLVRGLAAGRPALRGWALLALSALALFYLQPAVPIRGLDFWLPLASLALAAGSWFATGPRAALTREDWTAAGVLAGTALLVGLTRYLSPDPLITPTRPPQITAVLAGIAAAALLAGLLWLLSRRGGVGLPAALILALLALFVLLKVPALAQAASSGLRALVGQSTNLAAAADLRWLGFSYLAFRLIHTARDRQNGRLPAVSLREYVTYAVFYPALTAGPIDRLERFLKDLRAPFEPDAAGLLQAGRRLAWGLFKKFVLAAALSMVALNEVNAGQVSGAGWMWLLVYAYALLIYFDFSGYTDIAVGLGLLVGIRLPENFNAPYLKPNLTLFWNNWHMTLTQWFRAYFFNPLTRWLRTRPHPLSLAAMILITQVSTFVLIGLWHGVSLNFALWGLWHGLGLFVQNRWSEFARARFTPAQGRRAAALNLLGGLATFHYVALGWVWFALPTLGLSWQVFLRLFGLG